MKEDAARDVMEAYLLVAGAQYALENYGERAGAAEGKNGREKVTQLMMSAVCLAEWRLKDVLELEEEEK